MAKKKLVFLGGTCGANMWRISFIARLVARGVPAESLFNPVVEHWDAAAQANEERVKTEASHHLYFLATPSEAGDQLSAYSMVEATMALYDRPETTVVVFDHSGITAGHLLKAHKQTEAVLRARFPNANIFGSSQDAEDWLVKELKSKRWFGTAA